MRLSANRVALALCLYAALLGVLYAHETPVFEAPDEGAHFLYIHNLLETGELPVLEDREAVFESRAVQRHHPPLYYLIGAGLISWTERADVERYFVDNPFGAAGFVIDLNRNIYLHSPQAPQGDTHVAVWVLRLYSLSLGVATLWLVYRSGQLAFAERPVGLLALFVAVSIPGFIAGAASINNDNLVIFLFTAGIHRVLVVWRRERVTTFDLAVFALTLGGAALTKLNGLALFPLVYAGLVWGALRGRLAWRDVWRVGGVTLLAAALLAGWWYARNWQLYGDPLALSATREVWGRDGNLPDNARLVLLEAMHVLDSFWMTLGHFNLRGPEWLYTYAPLAALAALPGLVRAWRRAGPRGRDALLFLGASCALIIVALVTATRQINVSQGRILYPAILGFAVLLALGWRALVGRFAPLVVVPLATVTLATPFLYLDHAFQHIEVVDELPAAATPVGATSEGLTLEGYRLFTETVAPGEQVRLELFVRGNHPDNPAMFVKALDPNNQQTLGGVDFYPGMAPTEALDDTLLYRVYVQFPIDAGIPLDTGPMQLRLAVGWRVPETERFLPLRDANGVEIDILTLAGPVVMGAPEASPEAQTPTHAGSAETEPPEEAPLVATFGDQIQLLSYTLPDSVAAGETLSVGLNWKATRPIEQDYVLTVGLLDADGRLVAQHDGEPEGYPTSAWIVGEAFQLTRDILLPPDVPPGEYEVYVGWYSLPAVRRLPVQGDQARDDLIILPAPLRVVESAVEG